MRSIKEVMSLFPRTGVVGLLFGVFYLIPILVFLLSQLLYTIFDCSGGYIDSELSCLLFPMPLLLHFLGQILIPTWLIFTFPVGFALLVITIMRIVKLQKEIKAIPLE